MAKRRATTTTAAALLLALVAPAPATAEAVAEPAVNGGIVTDTNYLSPDGTIRVLPLAPSTTTARAFSPDGGSLVYVEESLNELWVLEADGGAAKVADLGEAPVYHLAWSGDGGSVAVTSGFHRPRTGQTRSFLHVVDMATGTATELADTTWERDIRFMGIAWSHDSQQIAVSASDHFNEAHDVLWVSAASGAVTPLTSNCGWAGWDLSDECEYTLVTGGYRGLDMHPDGTRLVTVDHQGVYTVDVATGDATTLRGDGQNYNDLRWSPDGTRIAWTAVEEAGGVLDIVVYHDAVAGGDRTAVAHNVGSTWDWQPCTAESCPPFGAPRGKVSIELLGTGYGGRWITADISVTSAGKPASGVDEIPVVLQRRAAGRWKKVYAGTGYLIDAGEYQSRLRRPAPGKCRIKVIFPGDFEYQPAKFTSAGMRC